jgi:hypothetical protein
MRSAHNLASSQTDRDEAFEAELTGAGGDE